MVCFDIMVLACGFLDTHESIFFVASIFWDAIGSLLSHPFPQEPKESNSFIGHPRSLDPRFLDFIFVFSLDLPVALLYKIVS